MPPEITADLNEVSGSLAKVKNAFGDECVASDGFRSYEAARAANINCFIMFVRGEEPASRSLFTEPLKSHSAWVAAIQSGQDSYAPLPEIRAAMANWRAHVEKLLSEIREKQSYESELFSLEKREKTLKVESPEWEAIHNRISGLPWWPPRGNENGKERIPGMGHTATLLFYTAKFLGLRRRRSCV